MVQVCSDTCKRISPDAKMQEYFTAKYFIFTGADCYETQLNEKHNRTELLYQMHRLLVRGFWSR